LRNSGFMETSTIESTYRLEVCKLLDLPLFVNCHIPNFHVLILDYENQANPFEERRSATEKWKARAFVKVDASPELLTKADTLKGMGLRSKDALHLACAIWAACDFFVTTDDEILTKMAGLGEIHVVDPPGFIRRTER